MSRFSLILLLFVCLFALNNMLVFGLPYDVSPPKSYLCCDVDLDGRLNFGDIFTVVKSFGSMEGMTNWNPMADINRNGMIDVSDIIQVIHEVLAQFR